MKKLSNLLTIGIIVFLLASCATVEDIRRATDLIRTDNELTRLLVEVRPGDKLGAATYLTGLATHAKDEADALKSTPSKIPDAIAYYRIAATAYWRSGNPDVANALFNVSNSGNDLCAQLGDKAPNRDCLFLMLVIPFAGLESNANGKGLSGLIKKVDFRDRIASTEEIAAMKEIRGSLNEAKSLVEKIYKVGADNRLSTHPGMSKYYCDNLKKAYNFYDSNAAVYVAKVAEYFEHIPSNTPPLGITLEEAKKLRMEEKEKPSLCQ